MLLDAKRELIDILQEGLCRPSKSNNSFLKMVIGGHAVTTVVFMKETIEDCYPLQLLTVCTNVQHEKTIFSTIDDIRLPIISLVSLGLRNVARTF